MGDQWIDFKTVKGMVTIAGLLEHYGVRFTYKTQLSNLPCPLPSHASQNRNSFNANLERNIWSCKSASCVAGRNGKEGGNVLDFVMAMEQCDLKTAATKILEWFGTVETKNSPPKVESHEESARTDPATPEPERKRIPLWKKNAPPSSDGALGGATVQHPATGHNNPSPLDHSVPAQPVKGYMKDVDAWFDGLVTDPPDWKAIKTAVKARLIESYKNGKAART